MTRVGPNAVCARPAGFLRRLARDRSGASLVEFSMLLWVFTALLFGVVEIGQIFWTQNALQHAVEMAARCASVNTTTCGTASQIQTFASTQAYGLTIPAATFTATVPACGNKVTAAYTYTFLTGFLPSPTVNLSAQSCYPK